jgi:hypothetical protein
MRGLAERLQGDEKGKAGELAGEKGRGPLKEEEGTGQSKPLIRKGKKKKKRKRTMEGKASRAMEATSNLQLLQRVDVSYICDANYVGLTRVLEDWGPLKQRGGRACRAFKSPHLCQVPSLSPMLLQGVAPPFPNKTDLSG